LRKKENCCCWFIPSLYVVLLIFVRSHSGSRIQLRYFVVLMTTRPPPSRQPADKYRRTSLYGGTSLKQCFRVDCGCLASQRYKHCPCRGATYCSTRCQLADWHRHRVDCIYAREHMTSCTHCGSCTVALLSCPCRVASYCSPECQSANWPHHGTHCTARARNKKPAQRMDPSGPLTRLCFWLCCLEWNGRTLPTSASETMAS
jgi:hypothetical protein